MFAVAPPGLEIAVAEELRALGMAAQRIVAGGVTFSGDREALYRANLWLSTASRVLVRVEQFFAVHLAQLHKKAKAIAWERYLDPTLPVEVRGSCRKSRIYHSKAAAERVALGIAERLKLPDLPGFGEGGPREEGGAHQVLFRIDRDHCTLSLDSSGEHLHRRGYRTESLEAPLRETLAAALLRLSGWKKNESLVDPLCGSGTIPIEAALFASGVAPGLRRSFAFLDWPTADPALWQRLLGEAAERVRSPDRPIRGSDIDAEAVWIARRNAERAGVSDIVEFERKDMDELPPQEGSGLLLTNPPYGKRIGERRRLRTLYAALGNAARRQTPGWRLGFVTSDRHFAAATGMDFPLVSAPFPNGGVRVRLYLSEGSPFEPKSRS